MERECEKHGETEFVLRKDGRWRCKKCAVDTVVRARRRMKSKAVTYKGGHCIHCGYDQCEAALAFHHRDPLEKEHEIFKLFNAGRRWEIVAAELDKCDLVCNNCHSEIEAGWRLP